MTMTRRAITTDTTRNILRQDRILDSEVCCAGLSLLLDQISNPRMMDHANPIRKNGVKINCNRPTMILFTTISHLFLLVCSTFSMLFAWLKPATIVPEPGSTIFRMRTYLAKCGYTCTFAISCISIFLHLSFYASLFFSAKNGKSIL